ncbi:universal stress protein UspA [Paenibacillus baekrokdamisoli]|uniref:Universal stress protein UspA n=1 Tax=Paenibacillus baekrokdamisoli TaxID=1712516 RepID=A0A3G9JJ78_9BACL|nr:universal stress protein [Paenibacillus baekrokdamisoli]MBB3071879.1 nucleotide-binding universal stress UspA family protein [Paenibacillus baekrokdamisoli]BBH24138.1 universal stress protein UspA [Paenibacillus baekrokdamisoli]
MFARILVGYDGSECSQRALDVAVKMVEENRASVITVAHVYHLPSMVLSQGYAIPESFVKEFDEQAKAMTSEALTRIAHLPESHAVTLNGTPYQAILEYADENGSDLIIIGSRGLGGFREMMLGSVSHRIVQHAKIPVMVVK